MRIRLLFTITCCLAALAWAGAGTARADETGGAAPTTVATGEAHASAPAAADQGQGKEAAAAREGDPGPDEFVAVDQVPEAVKKVPPKYPEAARKRGQEGTVLVRALVAKDGKVRKVLIAKGKGLAPDLDQAAAAAVGQWVFKPATADGKPVAVWVVIPIKFRLH